MSLSIERFETFILDVPTIREHVLSMATMTTQTMVFLRLTFSDGSIGIGEATTIGGLSYGPESPESIRVTLERYIKPIVTGQSFKTVGATMSLIDTSIVGNRFAKCAVEMALYDALGHRLGIPVSELLGGRIVDSLNVLWVLASGDLKTDISEAEHMINERRHNVFKIKIGKRSVEKDVAHVAEIKSALGDRASIRVDVNQAWSRSQANRGCRLLADAGIDLVEQPLSENDIAGAQQLVAQGIIPIMLDESVKGPEKTFHLAQGKSDDIYALKILQAGGLTKGREVAVIARRSGAELYGGTMLESSVCTIASAHLFSTLDTLEWGTELFAPLLLREQITEQSLEYRDFQLHVPNSAGLGVTLDEDKINYFSR